MINSPIEGTTDLKPDQLAALFMSNA
jgi:hypothetical protein